MICARVVFFNFVVLSRVSFLWCAGRVARAVCSTGLARPSRGRSVRRSLYKNACL